MTAKTTTKQASQQPEPTASVTMNLRHYQGPQKQFLDMNIPGHGWVKAFAHDKGGNPKAPDFRGTLNQGTLDDLRKQGVDQETIQKVKRTVGVWVGPNKANTRRVYYCKVDGYAQEFRFFGELDAPILPSKNAGQATQASPAQVLEPLGSAE